MKCADALYPVPKPNLSNCFRFNFPAIFVIFVSATQSALKRGSRFRSISALRIAELRGTDLNLEPILPLLKFTATAPAL
jgi:hypothetical protein